MSNFPQRSVHSLPPSPGTALRGPLPKVSAISSIKSSLTPYLYPSLCLPKIKLQIPRETLMTAVKVAAITVQKARASTVLRKRRVIKRNWAKPRTDREPGAESMMSELNGKCRLGFG